MGTISVKDEAAVAAFREAGLTEVQIQKALRGLHDARAQADVEVVVNPEEERKYGAISVFKVQPNGYRKNACGLSRRQAETLVTLLEGAIKTLKAEEAAKEKSAK